jgi:hypothetical protein
VRFAADLLHGNFAFWGWAHQSPVPYGCSRGRKGETLFTAKPDAQEEKELTTTKITIIRE